MEDLSRWSAFFSYLKIISAKLWILLSHPSPQFQSCLQRCRVSVLWRGLDRSFSSAMCWFCTDITWFYWDSRSSASPDLNTLQLILGSRYRNRSASNIKWILQTAAGPEHFKVWVLPFLDNKHNVFSETLHVYVLFSVWKGIPMLHVSEMSVIISLLFCWHNHGISVSLYLRFVC